jgi:diacylglycerol kinase family enzyme
MAEIRPETGDKPHYFMLRAGLGFEADVVEAANREMKEKLGSLAYLASGISKLRDAKVSNYQLRIDGERIDTDGICCFIANSASLGQGGFMLVPEVDVSDGLLDVIVVRKADAGAILNVAANVLRGNENPDLMPRWKGRDIHIVAEPAQNLQADGEIIGQSPVQVRAIPGAVRVLIPKPAAPAAPTDAATKQGEKSPS